MIHHSLHTLVNDRLNIVYTLPDPAPLQLLVVCMMYFCRSSTFIKHVCLSSLR